MMADPHKRRQKKIMSDPVRKARYEAEVARIESVDRVVNGFLQLLEERRATANISKAELARRIGANAVTVRRTLTSEDANPLFSTLVAYALELGIDNIPIATLAGEQAAISQNAKAPRTSSASPTSE